jgi:hypothetical protein
LLGSKVRCPSCKTPFTAEPPADAPAAPAAPKPAVERPSSPPSKPASVTDRPSKAPAKAGPVTDRPQRPPKPPPETEPEEEPFEEAADEEPEERQRPRRRRSGRSKEVARGKVMLPAIFLMIIGGLGLLLAILNTLAQLLGYGSGPGAGMFGPQAQMQGAQPDAVYKISAMAGAIAGYPWSLIILIGAIQMIRLKGRGSAMAASITAMVPCSLCCLLGLPIGIWSLVVLNNDEVRRGFG